MVSNENAADFSVSPVFQERLTKAFLGDERSKVEIAKDIGISKDVLIRALRVGLIPSTRSMVKIADYLEESVDYLLGFSDVSSQKKTIEGIPFYERLDELKNRANTKYGTIASSIGIYRSQFNSWKNKNIIPSLEICYQLALYFGVSLDYLLARE